LCVLGFKHSFELAGLPVIVWALIFEKMVHSFFIFLRQTLEAETMNKKETILEIKKYDILSIWLFTFGLA